MGNSLSSRIKDRVELQNPKPILQVCLLLFFISFSVRTLTWQDNRLNAWKVQTSVTNGYKVSARQLARGDIRAFLHDRDHLGHPPGYPILLAGIFRLFGESNTLLQFIQITLDSVASVVLFLLALELLPLSVASLAGLLASVSPQFAYFSVLLLPDSLIILPILLALYLIVRAYKAYSAWYFFFAGVLIGLSCWLRANALLLAPFLVLIIPLIVRNGKRYKAASSLIVGAILTIAPITIRNAIIFHRFVPLTLGAGQTLLEGIADYDETGALNIPKTDLGLMRQEAQRYGKPEYAQLLFGADGIERDRNRFARGLTIIGDHPVWFASVMARRALNSTRLDPVPILNAEYPVSQNFDNANRLIWERSSNELINGGERAPSARFTPVSNEWTRIRGDENNYGIQLASELIKVEPFHDYVFRVPFKLEEGRALIKVTNPAGTGQLASVDLNMVEGTSPSQQPVNQIALPFVSTNNTQVRIAIANNASVHPVVLVGSARIVELGQSRFSWSRYVRMPLRLLQRFFTTAWTIPLVVIGLVLLIRARKFQELALLLVVPAYYLIIQSALHTERRYVYVLHFFFLVLVSVALWWLVGALIAVIQRVRQGRTQS